MAFKPFSPDKYLFIKTLTVSIEQCEKVNLFKPSTPQRQKHRFVSHSHEPRAYIRTPLYVFCKIMIYRPHNVVSTISHLNVRSNNSSWVGGFIRTSFCNGMIRELWLLKMNVYLRM